MPKKSRMAKYFSKVKSAFTCPVCDQGVEVIDDKSVICSNQHTFDFAKQGYINFLTRPVHSNYQKELFVARNKIIVESNLYDPLHQTIANIIEEYGDKNPYPVMIVDLGCGEGSHLHKIINKSELSLTGIGLDIAKDGIMMAAKKYENSIWLVGDLAKSPLANHSFHVILNIFSPANYHEFKRMLVQNGLVVKVVPRSNYLQELRHMLKHKNDYNNERTIALFKEHFQLIDIQNVRYQKTLQKEELEHLVQMTPLTWSVAQTYIDSFLQQESSSITVDLDILIGRNY